MHPMNYLFSINNDFSLPRVETIFEPCYEYICKIGEELYQKNIRALKLQDEYYSFSLITRTFIRKPSPKYSHNPYKYCPIHESLYEEANKLEKLLDKTNRDIRQIQMWFSLSRSEATKEQLPVTFYWPHTLKTALHIEVDEPYIIPEGKEETWKKVESLINYYLGLKLLL